MENLPVGVFFKQLPQEVDGKALIACSTLAIIFAGLSSIDAFPLMQVNIDKQVILFLFTPLLLFGVLINLRWMSFSEGKYPAYFRAVVLIIGFIFLNF